ncbi:MAG: hypothetical protein QOH56_1439 [Pseudonocardiales bacterium]|jgi:hypothetical protein|nr:hypothetical protein [Pseudonocardiales bacterium]
MSNDPAPGTDGPTFADKSGHGLVESLGERAPAAVAAPVQALEQVADTVDRAVPMSDEPGNRVLVDNARLVRWAAPLFALCAVILLPWIVVAGLTLPSRQISENYDLAWAGYDVLLLIGLLATAILALRRSRLLPIAASATGALLTADAWFDVLTSPSGWDLVQAVAMCLLAELPLAFLCFWLAWHSQEVAEQRLVLLLRHPKSRPAATHGSECPS